MGFVGEIVWGGYLTVYRVGRDLWRRGLIVWVNMNRKCRIQFSRTRFCSGGNRFARFWRDV